MIRAVIFDVDNTLTDFMKMKRAAVDSAVESMIDAGLKVRKEAMVEKIFDTYWKEGVEDQKIFDKVLKAEFGRVDYKLLAAGIDPRQMAIITPYVAQVKLLKSLVRVPGLEIGSVDGFQGREKEVTIVSLVRNNEAGEVGFLSDIRRMNVAMTRARRLLIVIGDSATIGRHPFYAKFLDYADACGAHRSSYEWPEA